MLEKIRESTKGWFAWVVLITIAVVFSLWGVYGYLGVNASESQMAATVNGSDISRREVAEVAQRLQQQAIANQQQVPIATLERQALDQLIMQRLVIGDARDRGFAADRALVDRFIINQPEFQQNGEFSPALFEQISRQMGLQPYQLRELMVDEIIVGQLRMGIMSSEFTLPYEINRFLLIQNQQRDIQYLEFPINNFLTVAEMPEDKLEEYYQTNLTRWQIPEQVSVEYIRLTSAEIAQNIEVSDADVSAYYEQNKATFVTPEQRHVRHILLELPENPSEEQMQAVFAQAKQVVEKLEKGGDFATLAAKYSIDVTTREKGGDLGWISTGILPEPLDKKVFAAEANSVVEPTLTPYGIDIAEVVAIKPQQTQSLSEVKQMITALLRQQKEQERFIALQDELNALSYEMPDTLADIADQMNLSVQKTEFFTRDHGNADAITQNAEVRAAAFSDSVLGGENSPVIALSPEDVVVLRVAEHRPASYKPFAEVRADVLVMLQKEEATIKMRESLAQWLPQLDKGELTAEELASRLTAQWRTVTDVTRTTNEEKIPPIIRDYAFNLPRVVAAQRSSGWLPIGSDQFAIVVVNQIKDGNVPAVTAPEWQNTHRNLTLLREQADYMYYLARLRDTADIKYH